MLVPEIWISGSLQLVFLGWIPYSNSNDSIETTSYPCPPAYMYACLCMRVCIYFGPKRLLYLFLNSIFNLKGSCVTDTHTHSRLGLTDSLKGCYLKRPKNFFVKTSWEYMRVYVCMDVFTVCMHVCTHVCMYMYPSSLC